MFRSQTIVKKKAATTLAPFDMARLVAGYDDCYSSRGMPSLLAPGYKPDRFVDHSPKLVVILDQMEAYDTEVLQDLIYACRYLLHLSQITATPANNSF